MSDELPVVDCHVHLWYLDKWSVPWLDPKAFCNRTMPAEEYAREVADCGVVSTVFVETATTKAEIKAEAEAIVTLAADTQTLVQGAIVGCDLDAAPSAFTEYVDSLVSTSAIKGVREVMHVHPAGFCLRENVVANVKYLGSIGWLFEVCQQPDQLGDIAALVRQAPNTTFVLNHCGGHQGLAGTNGMGDADAMQRNAWEQGITELAGCPNVFAKVSGLYGGWSDGMQGGATWSLARQQDTMLHVLRNFSEDRLVFGSDWPVCSFSAPVRDFILQTKALVLEHFPPAFARKLFHDNAIKLYRLST